MRIAPVLVPIVLLSSSLMGCGASPPAPAKDGSSAAKTDAPAPAPVDAPSEPTPAPPVADAPPIEPPPTEPTPVVEPPPTEPAPNRLAATIVPVPGRVTWEERPGLSEILGFAELPLGVLAECGPDGGRWCELTKDGRLVRSKISDPKEHPLLGSWPDDAWQVVAEEDQKEQSWEDPELEAWVTVELRRWNGRRFAKETSMKIGVDPAMEAVGIPSFVVTPAATSGVFLYDGASVVRVSDSGTGAAVRTPGEIRGVYESLTKEVFLFVVEPSGQRSIHHPCFDDACRGRWFDFPAVDAGDLDAAWTLSMQVARGGDSVTFLAEQGDEQYLLHYDAEPVGPGGTSPSGKWTLEALPTYVTVIWPDESGGLWLDNRSTPWARRDGTWFEVEPPPGDVLGYANRLEPRELVVAVNGSDNVTRVYAASGPVTPRAAASPSPSPAVSPTAPPTEGTTAAPPPGDDTTPKTAPADEG